MVNAGHDYAAWHAASQLVASCEQKEPQPFLRQVSMCVLGSYTTQHFVPLLALVARRFGIALELTESPYGQYRQEILNPESTLYSLDPDFVVIAVHEGEVGLPAFSSSAIEETLDHECEAVDFALGKNKRTLQSPCRSVQLLPCLLKLHL